MDYFNLMYNADFYKVSHKAQYPENVTRVHSTLVARGANYNDHISKDEFMWFGLKLYLDKLNGFSDWFFNWSEYAVDEELRVYKEFLDTRLGGNNDVSHWKDLWELGSLPLTIKALDERSIVSFQNPLLTVENTDERFAWLTSFIETSALSNIWGPCTAANRSWHIRKSIEDVMEDHTPEEREAIDFMGHDFSYRGLIGDEAAMLVGCGHLANFKGSDTIPAIRAMEKVYGEVTGFSVPATEHSVMCAGGEENEDETYNRILDVYPTGIVSIVSDTWDYFSVLTDTLPSMKDKIMARDGKVVIRPDSGNPVDIICGTMPQEIQANSYEEFLYKAMEVICNRVDDETPHGEYGEMNPYDLFLWQGKIFKVTLDIFWNRYDKQFYYVDEAKVSSVEEVEVTNEMKGSLRILAEEFGYTLDSQGLKVLDSHVGLIYGDGMNQGRIKEMLKTMVATGFSPVNIVFGIGAFTYQLMTRDELGFAFKATAVEIDGEWVPIQKNPKTDTSKKSLTGRFESPELKEVF